MKLPAFLARKTIKLSKKEKPVSSPFSDFFRKASSAEKKRVFTIVTHEAAKAQKAYLQ